MSLSYITVDDPTWMQATWSGITYRLVTLSPVKAVDKDKLDEEHQASTGMPFPVFSDPGPHPALFPGRSPLLREFLYSKGTLLSHCKNLLDYGKRGGGIPVHLYFYYHEDGSVTIANELYPDRKEEYHLHYYLPCTISGTLSLLEKPSNDPYLILDYLLDMKRLRHVESTSP